MNVGTFSSSRRFRFGARTQKRVLCLTKGPKKVWLRNGEELRAGNTPCCSREWGPAGAHSRSRGSKRTSGFIRAARRRRGRRPDKFKWWSFFCALLKGNQGRDTSDTVGSPTPALPSCGVLGRAFFSGRSWKAAAFASASASRNTTL